MPAIHALDLPALYTKPSSKQLLDILSALKLEPTTFNTSSTHEAESSFQTSPINSSGTNASESENESKSGIPEYLTRIIASPLAWLDEDQRDLIWEAASKRLAERAGRSAAPCLTRSITLALPASKGPDGPDGQHGQHGPDEDADPAKITLHEPSLTADNLGHKTWSSSYMLATHLARLAPLLTSGDVHGAYGGSASAGPATDTDTDENANTSAKVLELGAGTGLLGIAYALCIPGANVLLTDLPSILANLARNVDANTALVAGRGNGSRISAAALDWNDAPLLERAEQGESRDLVERFDMILCADPVYDASHPELLVRCVRAYLAHAGRARFLLGVPLRDAYLSQVERLWDLLRQIGLEVCEQGELLGTDDWVDRSGERVLVRVRWALWGWREDR